MVAPSAAPSADALTERERTGRGSCPTRLSPPQPRPAVIDGQATLLLEQGVPARVVMDILGHSSSRITLDVYSHVTPRLSDEAAAAMERALWGEEA